MTERHAVHLLAGISFLCFSVLVVGVVWASKRGLELTDESYYLLSAVYPDQVRLYISAQHWILAPLWTLTESLRGFRLTGAGILLGSSTLLAIGGCQALAKTTGRVVQCLDRWITLTAGGVGSLLYVATIAPSPSYNLLASAGSNAATGLALIALGRTCRAMMVLSGCLGGMALAFVMVAKPTAGICVGLVVVTLVLSLRPDRRGLAVTVAGLTGALATLTFLSAIQPRDPGIIESMRGGLELFRMVQTEPVAERLLRYAVTLISSFGRALWSFSIAVLLLMLWWRHQKHWLLVGAILAYIVKLYAGENYLGGMQSYRRMADSIYVTVSIISVLAFSARQSLGKSHVLIASLFCLPFAASIGTGNSLFTQVIVALAPWVVAVALLAIVAEPRGRMTNLQIGATALLLVLLTAQIMTSYFRDPYHLARPLSGQTEAVGLPVLGAVMVDPETVRFLDQITKARNTCGLVDGAAYLGLFNLPGIAFPLAAVPPVTPWLNNPEQAETVLRRWSPSEAARVVIVLSPDAQANPDALPRNLRPAINGYQLCGHATVPYNGRKIEIWASSQG